MTTAGDPECTVTPQPRQGDLGGAACCVTLDTRAGRRPPNAGAGEPGHRPQPARRPPAPAGQPGHPRTRPVRLAAGPLRIPHPQQRIEP